MKNKKRTIALAIVFIISLPLISCSCSSDDSEVFGKEIMFPETTDGNLDPNATLTYNVAELSSQIPRNKAYYVSYDPIATDYKIVSKFGFYVEDYKLYDDGGRSYTADGRDEDKSLRIETNGRFSYKTGIKGTTFQITLSDKECYEIAKKFLQDNGLFLEEFGNKASVDEASALGSASEEHWVTALGVSFLAQGKYCDSRATVTINGNGEVTSVSYNAKQFAQHKKAKLISIEKAFERIKENRALIDVGELYSYSVLNFEKVSISYWEYKSDDNSILVQPVYIFEGTVTANDSTTHPFIVTVQANQYE